MEPTKLFIATDIKSITEILKQTRKSANLTQQELADKIGKERTYINRIEQGETDIQFSSFLRIANALGLEVAIAEK